LKNKTDCASPKFGVIAKLAKRLSPEENIALARFVQRSQHLQKRGLPAPTWASHGH
jgi:hypothetical protein